MKLQKALVGFVGLIAIAVIGLGLNTSAQTVKFATTNEAVKARAKYLVRSGIVSVTVDRVDGTVHVSRVRNENPLQATNYVHLDAIMVKGLKPFLSIGAVAYANDWIFATRVDFKIGEGVTKVFIK